MVCDKPEDQALYSDTAVSVSVSEYSDTAVSVSDKAVRGGGSPRGRQYAISVDGRRAGSPVYGRALIIGIQNYDGDQRLKNPVNDATDVRAKLVEIGFDVVALLTDDTVAGGKVTKDAMLDAIEKFVESVDEDTVAVFAFMGHGVEENGNHYLMPQELPTKHLKSNAISQTETLDEIDAKSPLLTMAILDCCRERVTGNRGAMTNTKGLRGLSGPAGSLTMYACGEGGYAKDSSGGRNGVFTE